MYVIDIHGISNHGEKLPEPYDPSKDTHGVCYYDLGNGGATIMTGGHRYNSVSNTSDLKLTDVTDMVDNMLSDGWTINEIIDYMQDNYN